LSVANWCLQSNVTPDSRRQGNFSPSRVHIIETLLAHGYPMGRGCNACGTTFATILCKPSHDGGYGHSTVVGGPVHEEDRRVRQISQLDSCLARGLRHVTPHAPCNVRH